MATPIATKNPIIADTMALPEAGSIYAKAVDNEKKIDKVKAVICLE